MPELSILAMVQWFVVVFTATSGAASILGGILAWKSSGVMTILTELRDGQRQGNETLAQIHGQLTTLVERLAPPPTKDR